MLSRQQGEGVEGAEVPAAETRVSVIYHYFCIVEERSYSVISWGWLTGWAGQPPHMDTVSMNQPAVLLSRINESVTIRTNQSNRLLVVHARLGFARGVACAPTLALVC